MIIFFIGRLLHFNFNGFIFGRQCLTLVKRLSGNFSLDLTKYELLPGVEAATLIFDIDSTEFVLAGPVYDPAARPEDDGTTGSNDAGDAGSRDEESDSGPDDGDSAGGGGGGGGGAAG